MQDKHAKPQQYIDGFITNRRPSASIGSRLRTGAASGATAMPSLAQAKPPVVRPQAPPTPQRPTSASAQPSAARLQPTSGAIPSPSTRSRLHAIGRQRPGKATETAAKKVQKRWKILTKRSALVMLALFVVAGGWLGWKVYRNTSKVFGNNNPLHVLSAFKPVPLKGEATGHVNILLAGNSEDRADGGGGLLTDSIMVVSINTKTHDAYMVSIPRDLWVNAPGIGYTKINAANTYQDFAEAGYPKGGMGALEKTVSDTLGIPINYYALVNYTAFKDAVNTVGGIDVNIQSTDPRGLYDPSFRPNEGGALKLPNGVNHLNGQTALNLARARGDPFNGVYGAYGFPQSDFDRTTHQRQMMVALKEKAASSSTLANPTKLGKLMDAIGNNVKTDFQLNELLSLYHMGKKVDSSKIQSIGLNDADGHNLLSNYTTAQGQSALVPAAGITDFSAIQAYLKKTINATPVTKEAASMTILNSGQVAGLAKQTGDFLSEKGAVITAVSDAPKAYDKTTIIDNTKGKKKATKQLLKDTFKNSTFVTDQTLSQQYTTDFIVILGTNQQAPAAGTN